LLEVERRQKELVALESADLQRARAILATYDVAGPEFEAVKLVRLPDVVTLLRAIGAKVEVVEPALADYQGAERRAALHLAPLRPQSESDEMRDLVIWEVACRFAKSEGGAVLLSKDHVHTGTDGDAEAGPIGLQRVKSFDAALDIIGVESPRAKLVKRALDQIWPELRRSLDLPETNSVRRVTDVSFVQGEEHIARIRFGFKLDGAGGKTLAGLALIEGSANNQIHAVFSELSVGGKPHDPPSVELMVAGTLPSFASDVSERLDDLRGLLGQS
jgi:hypothetical protein